MPDRLRQPAFNCSAVGKKQSKQKRSKTGLPDCFFDFFIFFFKEKENTMEVGGNGHCVAEKTIPTSGRERITAQRQSEPDGKHGAVHVKLVGVPYE